MLPVSSIFAGMAFPLLSGFAFVDFPAAPQSFPQNYDPKIGVAQNLLFYFCLKFLNSM
jgi:hypothetical protein